LLSFTSILDSFDLSYFLKHHQEENSRDSDLKILYDLEFLEIDARQLYILTPERCLGLLQLMYRREYRPDIIFVDEIQNVEDEGGRDVLEHV
jgi:hypothetical protein